MYSSVKAQLDVLAALRLLDELAVEVAPEDVDLDLVLPLVTAQALFEYELKTLFADEVAETEPFVVLKLLFVRFCHVPEDVREERSLRVVAFRAGDDLQPRPVDDLRFDTGKQVEGHVGDEQ